MHVTGKGSEEEYQSIVNAFNRTELREGEKQINNGDFAIAKELNIPYNRVKYTVEKYLHNKILDTQLRHNHITFVKYNQLYRL